MPPQPRYLEIADSLRSRIGPGKDFPPGAQLPTREALKEEYGVSEITIDAAMRELRRDGLTETVHGRGVFVREAPAEAGGDDQG